MILLAITGIVLFAKMGTHGTNRVKMLGFEFQLSGSALVVFVVGLDSLYQTRCGDTQHDPIIEDHWMVGMVGENSKEWISVWLHLRLPEPAV